jgi:hypothetical protein
MNLSEALSRKPALQSILTISYEGMELRVADGGKDACCKGLDFMAMQFTVRLNTKDGSYSIAFKKNKMIQALIRKFDTNKFDTILEIIQYNVPDDVLVSYEQKATEISFE